MITKPFTPWKILCHPLPDIIYQRSLNSFIFAQESSKTLVLQLAGVLSRNRGQLAPLLDPSGQEIHRPPSIGGGTASRTDRRIATYKATEACVMDCYIQNNGGIRDVSPWASYTAYVCVQRTLHTFAKRYVIHQSVHPSTDSCAVVVTRYYVHVIKPFSRLCSGVRRQVVFFLLCFFCLLWKYCE